MGSRSRSKTCCRTLTPAAYCKLVRQQSRRRRKKRSCRRRRKSRPHCGTGHRRSSRRRRRRRRSRPLWSKLVTKKKGKCGALGPKTTNPFLNFLRVLRRKRCGWPACRIAVEGAKLWCRMSRRDKMRFYREACCIRKKKRGHRRRRSRRRRRRRKC